LVEEFEREYGKEVKELRQQELEEEEKEFSRELLYGWRRKRYERKKEKRWDKNWS